MKKYIVILFLFIVLFDLTDLSAGALRKQEIIQNIEAENNNRRVIVRRITDPIVQQKQKIIQDLEALELLKNELSDIRKQIELENVELKKNQLQKKQSVVEADILQKNIPQIVTDFTDYYIWLNDEALNKNENKIFAQYVIKKINTIGSFVAGKEWVNYALLTPEERMQAKQRAILDTVFNKEYDNFLRASKQFTTVLLRNFSTALTGPIYQTIQKNINLLKQIESKQLSISSKILIQELLALTYTDLAYSFDELLRHPRYIRDVIQNLSISDKDYAIKSLKMEIRTLMKEAEASMAALKKSLLQERMNLEKWMAHNENKTFISLYRKIYKDNLDVATHERELVNYAQAIARAQNNVINNVYNVKQLEKSAQELEGFITKFIILLNNSDPSQQTINIIEEIRAKYNDCISRISKQGKNSNSFQDTYVLLKTLLSAFHHTTELAMIQRLFYNYLTTVLDDKLITLPAIKRDYAFKLEQEEVKPTDSVQLKRLNLLRMHKRTLPIAHVFDLSQDALEDLTWLLKGIYEKAPGVH